MVMECTNPNCKDFHPSMNQIIAAQQLATTHGMRYTGAVMRFCAWCGEELKPTDDFPLPTLDELKGEG